MASGCGEIQHIFIIGFHHKKGCQVEFSYPPLETLPEQWKTLPSLAMPDGAHNYDKDAVYFHLPSISSCGKTLFGISCFQQIPLEKVRNKTEDMTRGTVQKAVCVLSTVPLYGYIQVKMELVTATFFDGGDFSQTGLLVDAFHHLNACLPTSFEQHLLDGLSLRDILLRFRHRTLLLFKLFLLEKKVVFFHSPVEPLCSTILSFLSLHPGIIEFGLYESAFSGTNCSEEVPTTSLSTNKFPVQPDVVPLMPDNHDSQNYTISALKENKTENVRCSPDIVQQDHMQSSSNDSSQNPEKIPTDEEALDALLIEDYFCDDVQRTKIPKLRRGESVEAMKSETSSTSYDITLVSNLDLKACGLPLELFGKGNYFFPYLSISYLDFLDSASIRGFLAGATNVLFKQKRQLTDVLVEIETMRVETQCPELRKQLSLTTEDLRFMEQLLRGIVDPRDVIVPGIGREGGDDWIRAHFTLYLAAIMRTSLLQDGSRELDHFNQNFISAWKNTHNYKMWSGQEPNGIWELNPGHPGAGSLSMNDVRLRLSQAMQSSESGRKLNQAVTTTGRAVGGAITQAKGVLTGWWSNFTAQDGKPIKSIENA